MTNNINIDELILMINNEFPDWIQTAANKYCDNYPVFTFSWNYICKVSGFIPSKVVIVSSKEQEIERRDRLNFFLNSLYRAGCFVRLDIYFSLCSTCSQVAVPSELMYNMILTERGIKSIPPVWTPTCKQCQTKE